VRKRLLATLFICISIFTIPAQDEGIESINIHPGVVVEGERFTVKILVDEPDPALVSVEDLSLPPEISLYSGPSIRGNTEFGDDGSRRDRTQITYSFRARRAGRHVLPGLTIHSGDEILRTGDILIRVAVYQYGQLVIPLSGEWVIPEREYFIGDAIPLLLTLLKQEEILLIDRVRVNAPKGGALEELSGLGEIKERELGGTLLYDIPAGSYLFTPTRAGRVEIPLALIDAAGLTGRVPAQSITVIPLPEQVEETGAIGDLTRTLSLEKREVYRQGEELLITIRISGTGNLHYLQIPEPTFRGATLLDTEEVQQYSPDLLGLRGYRENHYRFLLETPGSQTIIAPPFPAYDPIRQEFHTELPQVISLPVEKSLSETGEIPSVHFHPLSAEETASFHHSAVWGNGWYYLLLIPGPLLFFIFLLLKKKKLFLFASIILLLAAGSQDELDYSSTSRGCALYEEEEYDKARAQFQEGLNQDPENPALHYNLALCYYKLDDPGKGIHHLRTALYYAPMEQKIRMTLETIQSELGLDQQVPPVLPVHPDLFFFLLIFFINLAALIAIWGLFRLGSIKIIIIIMFGLFTIGAAIGLLYTIGNRSRVNGVVGIEASEMKRIPRQDAAFWLDLPEGLTLRVLGSSGDFYLVVTSYGLKGWVDRDQIILDKTIGKVREFGNLPDSGR
jgi:tetratricopeptide (TPR) repeat protein